MTLHDFIFQLIRSAGTKDGDQFPIVTVLQYINEEVAFVSRKFPEKVAFTVAVTSSGYYHSIPFVNQPVIAIDNVMVSGVGADKKRWKQLKGAIGNAV